MTFVHPDKSHWTMTGEALRQLDPDWDMDATRDRIIGLAVGTGYPITYLAEKVCDAVFRRILDGLAPRTDLVLDDFERRLIGGKA